MQEAISDLQADPTVLFLTPNGSGSWSGAANDPAAYGIRLIIVPAGNYTGYDDPNPTQQVPTWQPRSGGTAAEPLKAVYWDGVSTHIDTEDVPHSVDQAKPATFGSIVLQKDSGVFDVAYFEIYGLTLTSTFDVRGAVGCGMARCKTDHQSHAVRFRNGVSGAFVKECLLYRRFPFDAIHDVVGIVVQKGGAAPNTNVSIEHTTVLNYTDSIQVEHEVGPGEAPGLSVRHCHLGTDVEPLADGSSPLGLEQVGIDLKSGGTSTSPVTIEDNLTWGSRPNESSLYADTLHRFCTHTIWNRNVYAQCHAAIMLKAQYAVQGEPTSGWIDSHPVRTGEIFSRIEDQGPAAKYNEERPNAVGAVLVGPNGASLIGCQFIECDRLAEMPAHPSATRSWSDCIVYEGSKSTNVDYATVTKADPSSFALYIDEVPIPYTSLVVPVLKQRPRVQEPILTYMLRRFLRRLREVLTP